MFEYKVETVEESESGRSFKEQLQTLLNKLGEEGWELIETQPFAKKSGVEMFPSSGMTAVFILIFKRRLSE